MIKTYLSSIDNLDSIQYDKSLLTEPVYIYSEISGQYFCATYDYSEKEFKDYTIQSGQFRTGQAIKHFKLSWQPEYIGRIVKENKKRKYFRGSKTIRFFFRYNGKRLILVDVWNNQEGYIRPHEWNEFFCTRPGIESSTLEDVVILGQKFINSHKGYIVRRKDGRKYRI
jgi:hypothetical protein